MTDDVTRQIDRAYDFAGSIVDTLDSFAALAGNGKRAAPGDVKDGNPPHPPHPPQAMLVGKVVHGTQGQGTQGQRLPAQVIPVKVHALAAPPSSPWVPVAALHIVEAIGEDGKPVWIVTNGRDSAECGSRVFAEQVLAAIHAKGIR